MDKEIENLVMQQDGLGHGMIPVKQGICLMELLDIPLIQTLTREQKVRQRLD